MFFLNEGFPYWSLKCESTSRHFQPGEGPSRGLFRDCDNFTDGSFAALVPTLLNSNYLRMYAGMHRGKLPQLLSSSSQPTNLKFAA